jgi:D-threo-aldose 1-dehydrogenase
MQHSDVQNISARLFGKRSGPLGFGTGLLHHAGSPSNAVRLLREAHNQGITYFDTARLYAEGEAEKLLGEAFSHIRNDIIITTKVGILPIRRDLATRASGKAAAVLRRISPLKSVVPEPAAQHPEFGVFDPMRMQQSLETSLKLLRTDHVDALLLHECTLEDVRKDEVQAFLEQAVQSGKARRFGVAPAAQEMLAIAASGERFGDIAQFDGAIRAQFSPSGAGKPPLVITHSCLGHDFKNMVNRLGSDAGLRARWLQAAGVDAGDTEQVAKAFLAQALAQNRDGLVLFSTTRPERLKANLAAESWLKAPDRCAAAEKVIAEFRANGTASRQS